jgi:hypothetical protein
VLGDLNAILLFPGAEFNKGGLELHMVEQCVAACTPQRTPNATLPTSSRRARPQSTSSHHCSPDARPHCPPAHCTLARSRACTQAHTQTHARTRTHTHAHHLGRWGWWWVGNMSDRVCAWGLLGLRLKPPNPTGCSAQCDATPSAECDAGCQLPCLPRCVPAAAAATQCLSSHAACTHISSALARIWARTHAYSKIPCG